jgi:DNA-binding MarR family transcriptional regulator
MVAPSKVGFMAVAGRSRRVQTAAPVQGLPTELGDVLEFMRVIWQLDHALQKTSKRMEKSLGVTGLQRLVIRIVGRFPGILAGQLAKLLHLHPSTLTGVLKRLEDQGLLQRGADPFDARRSLFKLTQKGRSFDVAAEGTVEACVAHTLQGAPAHQLAAARALLSELAERLMTGLPPEPKVTSRKKPRARGRG